MSEFTELDLETDVSDLDADEARETLTKFMEVHEENVDVYDGLRAELDEKESEFQKKLSEKEEQLAEFRERLADEAAEHVQMPADLLADKFSMDELEQIIDEATEFSESEEPDEGDGDNEDRLTTFSEKPEKGRAESGNKTEYRQRAKMALGQNGFPTGGE